MIIKELITGYVTHVGRIPCICSTPIFWVRFLSKMKATKESPAFLNFQNTITENFSRPRFFNSFSEENTGDVLNPAFQPFPAPLPNKPSKYPFLSQIPFKQHWNLNQTSKTCRFCPLTARTSHVLYSYGLRVVWEIKRPSAQKYETFRFYPIQNWWLCRSSFRNSH